MTNRIPWKRALAAAGVAALLCVAAIPLRALVGETGRERVRVALSAHRVAAKWKAPIALEAGSERDSYVVFDKSAKKVATLRLVTLAVDGDAAEFAVVSALDGKPAALLAFGEGALEKRAAHAYGRLTGGRDESPFPGTELDRARTTAAVSAWLRTAKGGTE